MPCGENCERDVGMETESRGGKGAEKSGELKF